MALGQVNESLSQMHTEIRVSRRFPGRLPQAVDRCYGDTPVQLKTVDSRHRFQHSGIHLLKLQIGEQHAYHVSRCGGTAI